MPSLRHLVLPLALLLTMPAFAAVQRTGEASAVFRGKGPAGFKIEGKTSELKVEDTGQAVRFTVPLDTLRTGISLRDRHMKEKYLETQRYPNAVLEVPWSQVKLPQDGQESRGEAKGKMTLRDHTKDVQVKYTVKRVGSVYQVSGEVPLNIKDYDIEVPSYMGITVKPDITTQVAFSATKS